MHLGLDAEDGGAQGGALLSLSELFRPTLFTLSLRLS